MLSREEKNEADYYAVLSTVERQGEERGIEQGIEQEKIETARRLLKSGASLDTICSITELSNEKIEILMTKA
jgi:hypothetical protein